MGTKIIAFNEETGEEIRSFTGKNKGQKVTNAFGKGEWFAIFRSTVKILSERGLDHNDWRVLGEMMEALDYENQIGINQTEIAKKLGMNRPNVSRSIKKLINSGVIIAGEKFGTMRTYRMNPTFGWKGTAKNHRQAIKDYDERLAKANIKQVITGGKA